MEFKSQICTTREQSEKLLVLGLKKETADCHWFYHNEHWEIKIGFDLISCENLYPKYYIPAWSLHRLIELYSDVEDKSSLCIKDISYKMLIFCIGMAIHYGIFNKDYLEEKK